MRELLVIEYYVWSVLVLLCESVRVSLLNRVEYYVGLLG
jgi:hypothetical protein